jgi:hypothetical protein
MPSKFWGDGHYVLPTTTVEPYRLWFEWLKLALNDRVYDGDSEREIRFTDRRYDAWGDVQNTPFEDWWEDNWRTLFGMTTGVLEIPTGQLPPKSERFITLLIPLSGMRHKIGYQIDEILAKHPQFVASDDRPKADFELSEGYQQGFTKRLSESRRYLRFYELWLGQKTNGERDRVDLAVRAFVAWHKANPDEARYSVGNLTEAYKVYNQFLIDRDEGLRINRAEYALSQRLRGDDVTAEKARKAIGRDLAKARKIAQNLAAGQFPGDYSSV